MTDPDWRSRVAASVLALAVVFVVLGAFAPAAAAQESSTYVVEQGDKCIEVDPVTDEDKSVEEFYDYRNETFSSHGTVAYQQDNVSHLIVYEGSHGTSLVMVHDRLHEDDAEGTNGSSATFTLSGLPAGSDWAIRDDNYGGSDDTWDLSGSTRTVQWRWTRARTDGAAYRLGTDDFSVRINATFNENRWSGRYHGRIDEWKLVTGTDSGIQRETLDTSENVTVSPGSCGSEESSAPTARLDAPDAAAVNETATLDASDSETGPNAIYEWYVDDELVEDATGPTYETSFSAAGTHGVRVEVTDDGGTDVDEVEIQVVSDLQADIDAEETTVDVGEVVVFYGNDSSGSVSEYNWDFGDGSTATGVAPTHTYDEAGTYQVELVVESSNGHSSRDTVEVTVQETVAEEDDDGVIQQASEDGAGFGAEAALLAALVATLGLRRRSDR